MQAYSDSKLHDALLAFAIARKWKATLSNAVHPGWVATKMGGRGATDDLKQGSGDAGMACRKRRAGGNGDREVLLPQAGAQGGRGSL